VANERAVANMRPGVRPRSGDGDHVRIPEHRELSGVVAGFADLANRDVGGVVSLRCPRRFRNCTPNTALYPIGAGGIVSAGG
jgi:hypothetical protein